MRMKPETKTIASLLELRANNMIAVNPEYQRGAVWSVGQKKRLIDSELRGYPIPLIYLHYIKKSVAGHTREDFEVIDGQQRLNALNEFKEGAFKLFDPVADDAEARFPAFVKDQPCPWGGKDFQHLDNQTREQFLATPLSVVMLETDNPNEARDLFIRLQAGMPLNAQEKRDAWPGRFTEFVLKVGGKPEIARYPGNDFFLKLMGAKATGRGKVRQLAAQMMMLFLKRRETGGQPLCDINSRAIDHFYYEHLGFDKDGPEAARFCQILDRLVALLGDKKRKNLLGHEAIHLVLLLDALLDDYTRSWESRFAEAFDQFRVRFADDKRTKDTASPGEYWTRYGQWTRVNSDRADTIQRRHEFFANRMLEALEPELKDPRRLFGALEREIIYARDKKRCGVCGSDVLWVEAEYHHVIDHAKGGRTELANGVLVHRECHPKGDAAKRFAERYERPQA